MRSDLTEQPKTITELSGRPLLLARIVWILLVALILALWLAGTTALVREPIPDCIGFPCDPIDLNAGDLEVVQALNLPTVFLGGLFTRLLAVVLALPYFVIGVIIFWRKSNDWLGLLVSFTLIFLGGAFFTSSDDALLRAYPELAGLLRALSFMGQVCLLSLFFLFPDGRFIPRRLKWGVWFLMAVILASDLALATAERSVYVGTPLALILFVAGILSQAYRYARISAPAERQQTKWVVVGLLGALLLMATWFTLATFYPPDQPSAGRIYALLIAVPLITLFGLLLPLSFAFSILRYRLWEIDVLINRGLVYGSLTLLLALIYFGSVVGLQQLVRSLTGQESPLAIVVATLLIAALFAPLRRRLQDLIDRRFYRRKYDAEQTLAAFAATARDEVDIDVLLAELVRVVEESMQPAGVSVWLAGRS